MHNNLQAHIIAHTHWDREWYLTFEQFRIKLIDLIDRLLEILDNDKEYYAFMMDGQTIVLEDYLAIKPYNESKIREYIENGRILIGPWYVLPDELLISGESHIRNYMIGDELCRKFRSKMPAGYLPDSFGHPSQMPQILKGLGLDTMVFWRGASHEMDKTEFIWKAIDGSKVIAVNMPYGYGNSARLSDDIEKTLPRVENMCKALAEYSTTGVILLMNGSDHVLPQGNLPEILKDLNKQLKYCNIRHSTLPEFLNELLPKLTDLKTFEGELRHSDKALILGGTLSTRMYLKQKNHKVEKTIERYVEPFAVIDWLKGERYPEDFIKTTWKYILQNQPHDSICGCSIDEVHREMLARYDKIDELENELLTRSLRSISDSIARANKDCDAVIVLYNPTQNLRTDYVEFYADFDRVLIREVNFDKSIIEEYESLICHPEAPEGIEVFDGKGRRLHSVILAKDKSYELMKSDYTLPEVYKVNRCRIGILATDIAPLGYTTVYIKKAVQNSATQVFPNNQKNFIENEYFKITVNKSDGTIIIADKISGRIYNGCNRFIDGADAGDEYTYSFPAEDRIYGLNEEDFITSIEVTEGISSSITIKGALNLPETISEDRRTRSQSLVQCPFASVITLYNKMQRIDIRTEIENNAKDHRLRVAFPTGVKSDYSYAAGHFIVEKRSAEAKQIENWEEMPQATHPHKGFVDVNDSTTGLAVIAKGIPEFEVINDGEQSIIALTLLRCVGWLSRPDLLTRKGNGGWTLPTAEAQCLGKHRFEYSLLPHGGGWMNAKVYIAADEFIHPVYPMQSYYTGGDLKDEYSLITEMPDIWRLSAVKKADGEDSVIIRFYSLASVETNGKITFGEDIRLAEEVSLNEKSIRKFSIHGRSIELTLRPGEIKTLKLFRA